MPMIMMKYPKYRTAKTHPSNDCTPVDAFTAVALMSVAWPDPNGSQLVKLMNDRQF